MKEKLTKATEKVKAVFGKMSKKVRVLLGLLLAAMLIAVVAVALLANNQPYEVLFTGLSREEAASIMAYLEENGVADYKLEGSDTILVPKSREPALKARLLMADYPKSGFAYDTYMNNISALSTESERRKAFLLALQDRISAVIRCFDGVKEAYVTIAEGEDRGYVLDSGNVINASAAVQVVMKDGYTLTGKQAEAIRSLVSRSVQGLEIDDITITDAEGNTYPGGSEASVSDASQLKLQLETQVNNQLRNNILQVLVPLYGAENVRVAVNSTVDVSRRVGESTQYTSPEGAPEGQGIIGSRIYDQEIVRGTGEGVGGVVGTGANADIPTYVDTQLQVNGNEDYIKNQGEEQFNVNSEKEQVERLAGTVTDVMVAVTINSTTAGPVDVTSLQGHVARAAGIGADFQAEKISILPQPFYVEPSILPPQVEDIPAWMIYAAVGGGLLFLLILLVILLVSRHNKKKRRKRQEEALLAAAQAAIPVPEPVTDGADIMDIQTERSMELRKDIRQFSEENPEIAAQMVRTWLRGGDDSNGR